MAKVKKMALGGMGKTVMPGSRNTQTPVGSGFKPTVLPSPRGGMELKPMPGGGPSKIQPPTVISNPRGNNMEKMPSSGGMERKPMPGTVMTQPGFKPLPPGSIGMPGGPGGKTVYNTGPMPPQVGMKKGGKVSSASKRADGIAQRGKTRA